MPGFLYYLPGLNYASASKDECRQRLAHAMEDRVLKGECHGGPDGERGVLVIDPARVPSERLGYYDSRQEWRPAPGRRFWLGWYTDEPPTPRDLARREQLAGHLVRLADGRDWLCPIARGASETEGELHVHRALPGVAGLDDEGHWTSGEIAPKYRRLWDIATDFATAFFGAEQAADGVAFDFHNAQQHAVECLGANYAIGPVEAAALGLLDDQLYAARRILQASIDWPVLETWLKKKAAALAAESPAG